MRVLVVDDDEDLLGDLEAVKPEGVELLAARGAEEAIAALKAEDIGLVLLDLRMPQSLAGSDENEGLALLGTIMGAFRGRVPVVVVTDCDDPEVAMWCGRLGAAGIHRKTAGLSRVFETLAAAALGERGAAQGKPSRAR